MVSHPCNVDGILNGGLEDFNFGLEEDSSRNDNNDHDYYVDHLMSPTNTNQLPPIFLDDPDLEFSLETEDDPLVPGNHDLLSSSGCLPVLTDEHFKILRKDSSPFVKGTTTDAEPTQPEVIKNEGVSKYSDVNDEKSDNETLMDPKDSLNQYPKDVKIGILQDNGSSIVVEAVIVEDDKNLEPDSIFSHEAVLEKPTPIKVKGKARPIAKKGGKGGRPIVWPRDESLSPCQNSRKRKREEEMKIETQVDVMEKAYHLVYPNARLDIIYNCLGLEDEEVDVPKERSAKRQKAGTEFERRQRKREQNREQTKKYREKKNKISRNNKKKWNCLVQHIPFEQLTQLNITAMTVEFKPVFL